MKKYFTISGILFICLLALSFLFIKFAIFLAQASTLKLIGCMLVFSLFGGLILRFTIFDHK